MNYGSNRYSARALRVVDGDTIYLDIDLGLRVRRKLYVRLVGIDAPEPRGETREAGNAATHALRDLVLDQRLIVAFEKGKSFDRWLGKLYIEKGEQLIDVQETLVKSGHAIQVDE